MQVISWLEKAKHYLGQHEIAGDGDNAFIVQCFKFTTYWSVIKKMLRKRDEVAWCAAFVSRCLEESGYKSTRSAAAVSYAKFGAKCQIQPGAIVVFKWADGSHHVSMIDHVIDEKNVACVGGNQSNMVKMSIFPRSRIMATRWPVERLQKAS